MMILNVNYFSLLVSIWSNVLCLSNLKHRRKSTLCSKIMCWINSQSHTFIYTWIFYYRKSASQKSALVIPLLKKAGLGVNLLNNYLPVSQILENTLCDQLTSFLDHHHIYNKFQSSYIKHKNTETILTRISNDIWF